MEEQGTHKRFCYFCKFCCFRRLAAHGEGSSLPRLIQRILAASFSKKTASHRSIVDARLAGKFDSIKVELRNVDDDREESARLSRHLARFENSRADAKRFLFGNWRREEDGTK